MSSANVTAVRLPTIGIISNAPGDSYWMSIACGISETLTERGFHTVCLSGGFPTAPFYSATSESPLVPAPFSGLISLSATLRGADRELTRLAVQHGSRLVTIGAELTNATTIAADDEAGVFQAVVHLVKHHGRRKIAFIAGPEGSPDAARRLGAYRIALQALNLAHDPALVVRGDFEAQSGHEAVLQLRRFGNAGFDAIVAANDLMAIGAIEGLRAGQLDVPNDVAVIGFDDMVEASFTAPGLTTVRQPVYEQGVSAARALLRQLDGEATTESLTRIPSPLVIRGSCGCRGSNRPTRARANWLERDVESLDGALRSLLRRELAGRRTQRELARIAEDIVAVGDFAELAGVMTRAFRLLHLRRFLLCLYTHDDRRARVVLESNGREVVFRNKGPSFPIAQLLPLGFLHGKRSLQVTVEALTVKNEHFGYMVIDADFRSANARAELRHFLSTALSRIARGRELRQLYADLRRDPRRRPDAGSVTNAGDSERPAPSTLIPRPISRQEPSRDAGSTELK